MLLSQFAKEGFGIGQSTNMLKESVCQFFVRRIQPIGAKKKVEMVFGKQ